MAKILVADDEPFIRRLVDATLASEVCEVVQACDGVEAWEVLRRDRPLVAILDGHMPGLTGVQLTRAIREDPLLASTRVILLSGRAQARDVEAAREAGADLYLTKPFSPLELLTVVEQVLEGGSGWVPEADEGVAEHL